MFALSLKKKNLASGFYVTGKDFNPSNITQIDYINVSKRDIYK